MSGGFEAHHLFNLHPDQVAFWDGQLGHGLEETRLVRDFSPERDAPWAELQAEIPAPVVARLVGITGGDRRLERVLSLAVAALVVARTAGVRRVTCLLATGEPVNALLPIRVDLRGLETFRDLLALVRARYLDAAVNGDIPVAALMEERRIRPTDVVVGLGPEDPGPRLEPPGCALGLWVDRGEATARLTARYRSGAFTRETVARLVDGLVACLARCTGDPRTPMRELYAAGASDREALRRFNATSASFPGHRLLHSWLEEGARAFPDRVALSAGDGTLTYAALNRMANGVAAELRRRGVGREAVVGVRLPRSPEMVAAIYGVLKAGAAYLPLDVGLPAARLELVLAGSRAVCVIDRGGEGAPLPSTVPAVDVDEALAAGEAEDGPATAGHPGQLCYVIYTSGSTGAPKGVMVEHRAIVNRLHWMQRRHPLEGGDVVLHKTRAMFDVSVWELFWWSLAGAGVALLPPGAERSPQRIIDLVRRHRVTAVHFVPSMVHGFLRYVEAAGAAPDLASLRYLFASGEALGQHHVEAFGRALGAANRTRLVNLYGPTEAAVDVSFFDCPPGLAGRPVPIGRPIANLALHVRGPDGETAPIGTPGELCLSGIGLARGYRGRPDLTAERFVPGEGGERLYRTGDRARWRPDGVVEYLGRLDDQVKIRGMRVEPGEVEHVLRAQAGVEDCAVTAVEPAPGEPALCAYVVGRSVTEERLREALGAVLPDWMVPRFLVLVPEIPLGPNGKRDVRRLPAPTTRRPAPAAPAGDARQRLLAGIWAAALGVEAVGVHDDFFALGGDSIRFISLLAASREAGIDFTFEQLFRHPTVEGLVASLPERAERQGHGDTAPRALVGARDRGRLPVTAVDAYPLGSLQLGILYESARSGNPGLYHDVFAHRVRDRFDRACFAAAVERLVRRHEILRSTFHLEGYDVPLQVVHDTAPAPLRVFDLRGMDAVEQGRRLEEYVRLELASTFEPEAGGLLRVHVHLLSDAEYQYTLCFHDAAVDGWSVHSLHAELFETYLRLRAGETPAEEPEPLPYRHYAALEREARASEEQRGFWLRHLAGAETTRIPRCAAVPGAAGRRVASHPIVLPVGLSDRLRGLAARLGVPVKSVLLAAHVKVLGFLAGSEDVLTGYEHSGRPEVEHAESTLGLFLNTVPFRLDCRAGTWEDLVHRTHDVESLILPHRRFPMAEIKRALHRRDALFDAVFNFTHFHVLKRLAGHPGFELVTTIANAQTEFPFRAEFGQDAWSDDVTLHLDYHDHEFSPGQVERVAGYYVRAMELMTAAPRADHDAETLMGEEERRVLLAEFGGPARRLPDATFMDLLRGVARRMPGAVALRHGASRFTYAELVAAAGSLASGLRAAGVGRGQVVAVAMERTVEWALCLPAILQLGAVYCPLELAHPAHRTAAAMARSGSRVVLTTAACRDRAARLLREAGLEPAGCRLLAAEELAAEGLAAAGDSPDPAAAPDAPAYILFTSGSTGQPKGATIAHRGMLNHLLAKVDELRLTERDRVAQNASQSFDVSVWQLLAPWLAGATAVIYGDDVVRDPARQLRLLEEDGITVFETVPAYLDAVLDLEDGLPGLTRLRRVILNAEPFPPRLTERWFRRYRIPMLNTYGATEASDDVTHVVLEGPVLRERVPVGRPIANAHVHVADPRGRLRPIGSYGELHISGACVGAGYAGDPRRTAGAFLPNAFDERSPLVYRTGDIGRWLPDGALDVVGRIDHQVKIRGFRVELAEVEGALYRVAGVDHAAAVVQDHAGAAQLVAFYAGPAPPDAAAFRAALAELLPAYMVPERVVRLDRLPLNPNGKVDRRRLEALRPAAAGSGELPSSPAHRRLVELFGAVLGVAPGAIGLDDNFFDLGGHSLAAIRLAGRSGGALTVRDVLTHPTVRGLAAHVEERRTRRPPLLIDLSAASSAGEPAPPEVTVVCTPYAGGDAVTFVPLARHLGGVAPRVRVLGLQPPGRTLNAPDPELLDFERLAERCVEELSAGAGGPVAVLGHCSGAALALRVAGRLEAAGFDVRRLFVVARVIDGAAPDAYAVNDFAHAPDGEILDWLVERTGLTEVAQMTAAQRADLARAFRHDAVQAYQVLHRALRDVASARLRTPITVVLADDDPTTAASAGRARDWSRFTPELDVVTTPTGGHYLTRTRPALLADVLQRRLLGPPGS